MNTQNLGQCPRPFGWTLAIHPAVNVLALGVHEIGNGLVAAQLLHSRDDFVLFHDLSVIHRVTNARPQMRKRSIKIL